MVPDSLSEITPEWLSDRLRDAGVSLRAGIRRLDTTVLAAGVGLAGQIARIVPEYAAEEHTAPASLIVKLPPGSGEARAVCDRLRLFERECRFYMEVSDGSLLRTPLCFHAAYEGDTGRAVLLLEDFSFARLGNQLTGWAAGEAVIALQHLAEFHGQWWDHSALEQFNWMPGWDSPEIMQMVTAAYQGMWPAFVERYGANLPQYVLSAGERLACELQAVAAGFSKPPHTITHGDFRMDNMFFSQTPAERFFGVIDWQLICRGRGAFDVAYFVSQSGPPDMRRVFEKELLRVYYDTLAHKIPSETYRYEEFFEDYRRGVLYSLVYPVVSSGGLNVEHDRARELIRTITQRVSTAMVDLDVAEILSP